MPGDGSLVGSAERRHGVSRRVLRSGPAVPDHGTRRGRHPGRPGRGQRSASPGTTPSTCCSRSPQRSATPTRRASSTATSSRRTSCSTAANRSSPTSGSPSLRDSTGTASTNIAASWLHAPPETFENERDERSDLYSLASTAHTVIAGSPPFWREDDESLHPLVNRLLNDAPPELAEQLAPPELRAFLVRAMAKDPAERPQSAAEFASAMAGIRGVSAPTPQVTDADRDPELTRHVGGLLAPPPGFDRRPTTLDTPAVAPTPTAETVVMTPVSPTETPPPQAAAPPATAPPATSPPAASPPVGSPAVGSPAVGSPAVAADATGAAGHLANRSASGPGSGGSGPILQPAGHPQASQRGPRPVAARAGVGPVRPAGR